MGIVIPFPAAAVRPAGAGASAPWPGASLAVALRWWGADRRASRGHGADQALRSVLLSAHGAEMPLEPIEGLGGLFAAARQRFVRT
ncbi:MAG: hypothetical protein JSR21_03650 [Proteobacteria bacterium]|nr:hypothetical protein [Pseudomonadota bacterium]